MKAQLIEQGLPEFTGSANLYELDEYVKFNDELDEENGGFFFNHVIVSGVEMAEVLSEMVSPHLPDEVMSPTETYIFPSNEEGKVLSWMELPGSFRGEINHEKALDGFLNSVE